MKHTGLATLLTLLASVTLTTNIYALSVTMTWPDPTLPRIYARAETSDSFSMNHTYTAAVSLKSPTREITQFMSGTAGYISATVYLVVQVMDLGAYVGSGTHTIKCPYNLYNIATTSAQSSGSIIRTGVSLTCFSLIPGTCTMLNGALYGGYQRLGTCILRCPTTVAKVNYKFSAGTTTCPATKPFMTFWTKVGNTELYKCWPDASATKWGNGPCAACGEFDKACSQCI